MLPQATGATLELEPDDELTARNTSEIRIKGKSIPVESELACSTITGDSTTGSAKEPAKEGDVAATIAAARKYFFTVVPFSE